MNENLEHFYQIKKKLIVEKISDNAFRICSLLISYAEADEAFPSIRTMAKILDKSKTTISAGVKELEDKSILKKINRTTGNGKKCSNLYKINKKYLVPLNFKETKNQMEEVFTYNWLGSDE